MRPTSHFDKLTKEREGQLVEQLIKSAAQGNTVQSAFFAGQVQAFREVPELYRKAHAPSEDDGL